MSHPQALAFRRSKAPRKKFQVLTHYWRHQGAVRTCLPRHIARTSTRDLGVVLRLPLLAKPREHNPRGFLFGRPPPRRYRCARDVSAPLQTPQARPAAPSDTHRPVLRTIAIEHLRHASTGPIWERAQPRTRMVLTSLSCRR
jgi:hypothetical protein